MTESLPDAFYLPAGTSDAGERFDSTLATRGPWSAEHQHGGPPAALLGRAIERCPGGLDDAFVGRVTVEILGPLPIVPVVVTAEVVRRGRSVELVEATLVEDDARSRVAMRARAWRLRRQAIALPADIPGPGDPPPPPSAGVESPPPFAQDVGWHTAVEFRSVKGSYSEVGPTTMWMRMRIGLVAGEPPAPLARTLVAADAGNGASAVLDWGAWQFSNTDLTVHLHREAAGEWVAVDSVTLPEPDGVGISDSRLYDERGPIGRGVQTLLIRPR